MFFLTRKSWLSTNKVGLLIKTCAGSILSKRNWLDIFLWKRAMNYFEICLEHGFDKNHKFQQLLWLVSQFNQDIHGFYYFWYFLAPKTITYLLKQKKSFFWRNFVEKSCLGGGSTYFTKITDFNNFQTIFMLNFLFLIQLKIVLGFGHLSLRYNSFFGIFYFLQNFGLQTYAPPQFCMLPDAPPPILQSTVKHSKNFKFDFHLNLATEKSSKTEEDCRNKMSRRNRPPQDRELPNNYG